MSRNTARRRLLILVLGMLGIATRAFATDQICVEIPTAFSDGSTGDNWTGAGGQEDSDGDVLARGIKIYVDEYTLWGGFLGTAYTGFTDDSTGCHTMTLNGFSKYLVRVRSEGLVNGVPIQVFDDQASPSYYYVAEATPWQPDAVPKHTVLLSLTTWSSAYAVGAFAMDQNNVGLGADLPLKYDDSNCCAGNINGYIQAASANRQKFVIGHETGHGVGARRDAVGGVPSSPDYSYASDPGSACNTGDNILPAPNHANTSREWYSAAIVEGFGDFFSASIWNDETQSNCDYRRNYSTDFDLDTTFDAFSYSCEGVPTGFLASYVSPDDWLEDLVNAVDPAGCGGTLNHRSTQYDVLRYLWDMRTDQGIPLASLVSLYDSANPRNWNPTFDILNSADDPEQRWINAAINLNLIVQHVNEDHNGMDH